MYDLIIKNGRVFDGSGSPERILDIAISGGKIANISEHIATAAKQTIDATGLVVSPGFIDVQNHSDVYWQLFENPGLASLSSQGFTTIILGQCGASLVPILNDNSMLPIRKWRSLDGLNIDWQTTGELKMLLNKTGLGVNAATLIGYETLRRSFTGDEARALSGEERKSILVQISTALKEGALGISFGLGYAHESATPEHEIKEVMSFASEHNVFISFHLRSEGARLFESVEEVIHLAEQTGARVKISHFKLRGRENWPQFEHVLSLLEKAWHKKISVQFDSYPYDTTWQVLYNYLPAWATGHGREHMLSQLKDQTQRRKILDYISSFHLGVGDFILASSTNRMPGVGRRISEIAKGLEQSSEETLLYLLEHGGSEVMVFDKNLSSDQLEKINAHPLGFIATDGAGYAFSDGIHSESRLVHPRCFGTAPKFLRTVLDKKIIPLSEAIRKLTSSPAKLLGLNKKGLLAINNDADIVIFDEKTISDQATLENPYQQSKGIEWVLVSGTPVINHGLTTAHLPGKFM